MTPRAAETWAGRAREARARQDMAGADAAISRACAAAPGDPQLAMMLAQLRYERGLPAAELFAAAAGLDPGNRDARRNQALALAAEGNPVAAEQILTEAIAVWPDWLDGLRVLTSLRWTAGDAAGFDRAWAAAARTHPQHQGIWLGWFGALAQIRDWPRAREVLEEAQRHLGATTALLSARAFLAGESADLEQCAALLDRLTDHQDDFLQVARVRLALRRGDPAAARDAALAMLGGPGARQAWPYLATAWRLLDDPLADWLEADPAFVRMHRVDLSQADLDELAGALRRLHRAQRPYAEQSVRGGTQTDRSVLLRHEPIFARTRQALMAAAATHVAGLPPHDARHPLLSQPRERLHMSGSWSVRLAAGGYNVTHSHPLGWLSSAFYVALPEPAGGEPAAAGHFHWGAPPPELGVDLGPRGLIKPEVGHVVIFPSYLWHGTVPTSSGERLNIAFDVAPA